MKFIISSYKKTLFIAIAMLFAVPQILLAQAEKPKNLLLYDHQPYHFGFIIGMNQMSYAIDYKDGYQLIGHDATEYPSANEAFYNADATYYTRAITPLFEPGFTVGVVGNLRLGKYFDLRLIPSLSFGSRTIEYDFYRENMDENKLIVKYSTLKKSIFSTFVEFPLQVKCKSKRYNNIAAYVIAGGNFKIDLASQKKDKTEDGVINNIKVKRTDIAAEIGTGFDFYTKHFKFGIEAKMSYGLLNVMDSQDLIYDSSINGLHNRMFQVSLTFE